MRLRVAWLWLLCACLPLAPAWAQGDSVDGEEAAVAHKIEAAADAPDGAPVATDPLTDDGRKIVPIDPRAAEGPAPGVLAPANSAPPEDPAFAPARPDGLPFTCEAAGVVDVATGQILYGHDLTKRLHPASTTKILTTLLALEAIEAGEVKMSDMVAISQTARETPESALWFWPGERMTLHDLLIGVMVRSANDASRAVAEHVGGGDAAVFVERMNTRAAELGAVNSHFMNPHGLHVDLEGRSAGGDDHYTCAYDLLLFTMAAWRFPFFRELCLMDGQFVTQGMGAEPKALPATATSPAFAAPPPQPAWRPVFNRNRLLAVYPECIGVKTGYTRQAGSCLVAAALRGERAVLAVTMKSASGSERWAEAEALLRWGLDEWVRQPVLLAGQPLVDVPVRWGAQPSVQLVAEESIDAVYPRDAVPPLPRLEVVAEVRAPVEAGRVLGQAVVELPNGRSQTVELHAAQSVDLAPLVRGVRTALMALGVGLLGVLWHGARTEARRRRRRLLAARRGTAHPRRPRSR